MLKLILIFISLLQHHAYLVRRTHFLSVETTTIYYYLSITQWQTGWNTVIF